MGGLDFLNLRRDSSSRFWPFSGRSATSAPDALLDDPGHTAFEEMGHKYSGALASEKATAASAIEFTIESGAVDANSAGDWIGGGNGDHGPSGCLKTKVRV